jgi:hypothetical protein
MSVLIIAGLHLDHWHAADRDPFADLPASFWSSRDALIIAGDLSKNPKVRWPVFLDDDRTDSSAGARICDPWQS